MKRVEELLREEWSPEQVAGRLGLEKALLISHETIYRHIWRDLKAAARCTRTCGVRASNAGNATGVTTAVGVWPGKG